jgi:DNA-binding HxlR family transcriptional regulator
VGYADLTDYPCSIIRPLTVLGDRWTFMVVKEAFAGTRRFEDFRRELGIPRSRLSDRLARLVEEGILYRSPYQDTGRTREEYRLTEKGLALYPILLAFRDWGDRYMAPDGPPMFYRHTDCRGEAHVHIICDECGTELTARDVTAEPGPGLAAPASAASGAAAAAKAAGAV